MTFDYTEAPSEYAEARRVTLRTMMLLVRTPGFSPLTDAPRTERIVADAVESFRATTPLTDGTRSAQIVSWGSLFTRVASAELGAVHA